MPSADLSEGEKLAATREGLVDEIVKPIVRDLDQGQ